jgi:hypothetical protein
MTRIVWTRVCSASAIFALNGVALKSESTRTWSGASHSGKLPVPQARDSIRNPMNSPCVLHGDAFMAARNCFSDSAVQ